jgi:Protein of unknown function (DUF3551)
MRQSMLAISAVLAITATMTAGAGPAAAFDYPYCLQSRDAGVPGDCSYRSYAQCMATASGQVATCNINPRVAFRAPDPHHGRPHRHHHD